MTFDEYLSQPCETPECDRVATHNQDGKRVCNAHLAHGRPAFARND